MIHLLKLNDTSDYSYQADVSLATSIREFGEYERLKVALQTKDKKL